MTSNQNSDSATAVVTEAAVLWKMPWHTRLKNLAEASRHSVVQVRETPSGAVHTWLARARVTF